MLSMPCRHRGRPTDIYALGACLFTFVYGRIPFSAPTVYQLFQVVQTEPLRFPEEPLVSDDLKDLLSQMLIKVGAACYSPHAPASEERICHSAPGCARASLHIKLLQHSPSTDLGLYRESAGRCSVLKYSAIVHYAN